jgi:hypothetical protein
MHLKLLQDCSAGEYTANQACIKCETGRYAPTAQRGACIGCYAGDFVNYKTGGTVCMPCPAGTYSLDFSFAVGGNCTHCAVGKWAPSRSSSCQDCAAGRFTNTTRSSSCTDCPAGRKQPALGARGCVDCTPGRYRASTGEKSCLNCQSGRYASDEGSLGCDFCLGGTDSFEGSRNCLLAKKNYYITTNVYSMSPDEREVAKVTL